MNIDRKKERLWIEASGEPALEVEELEVASEGDWEGQKSRTES